MRDEILAGKLPYPGISVFNLYPDQIEDILDFWDAIWISYLSDSDTNGLHWHDKLGPKTFNDLLRRLTHHQWVISHSLTGRKWASVELNTDKLLEYVTQEELEQVKASRRYAKYTLQCTRATTSSLVSQNGKVKRTGLVRTGFRDAGNTQFGYDMDALNKYEEAVKLNLTKSMDKIRQDYPEMKSTEASYDNVSVGIYDWHYDNKLETFTTGNNINDSRGRAISKALTKVANPISSKDFRAALVITYE